ncbi:hypothetical protein L6164_012845 [Bauhinia variegata]|uniref:Uncharacterized protein n=1 Tax=Bauhinia variegata TaxID=167791 RepID=A0ACB9PAC2_BAUVA|nr:hypothetical protein L6164_012845 [Bauhinia variegata]
MATLKHSLKSFLLREENENNPFAMSDAEILEHICATHVHDHSAPMFDLDSLFAIVEDILKCSTHIVDNVSHGIHGSPEHISHKIPQASFFSPLCTLKQISHEMSCKTPGEDIAHKTTLAILNKLSGYSWDAKAVLTLASFALEYGDFWLLSQLQPTDPLAKSVAILKRVPALTRPAALQKHCQDIVELNNLIKASLQVIEAIFELEKLTSYDVKEVPALAPAMEQIPIDVYWAIITIVACVTQIDCLTNDLEERQELSHFGQKINIILSKLRRQISLCMQQIEEAEYYKRLRKIVRTPTEIIEFFKATILGSCGFPWWRNGTVRCKKDEFLRSKMPWRVQVHQGGMALQEDAYVCGYEPSREGVET